MNRRPLPECRSTAPFLVGSAGVPEPYIVTLQSKVKQRMRSTDRPPLVFVAIELDRLKRMYVVLNWHLCIFDSLQSLFLACASSLFFSTRIQ